MKNNIFADAVIISCGKNCQSLNEYGNDLCQRRRLEERNIINIQYVGHTPSPAPQEEFLVNLSEGAVELLRSRNPSGWHSFLRVQACKSDGKAFLLAREWEAEILPLTQTELTSIRRQEIGDDSNFLCPNRRYWARMSNITTCVAIEHDEETILVDQHGAALNLKGEEIPLEIVVPIPGLPGSERVTYYPNTNGDFMGRSYYYRDNDRAPKCLRQVEKHLFRPSPEIVLEIEESEILILQKPVNSSDCGHRSDIEIFRAGDKIAKYTLGKNRYLLKPGETVNLPVSEQAPSGYYTEEIVFENRDGRLVKSRPAGKNFADEIKAKLMSEFACSPKECTILFKVAGPGQTLTAASIVADVEKHGINHVKKFFEEIKPLEITMPLHRFEKAVEKVIKFKRGWWVHNASCTKRAIKGAAALLESRYQNNRSLSDLKNHYRSLK